MYGLLFTQYSSFVTVDILNLKTYKCFYKACSWETSVRNIDWGYYSTENGNCSLCMDTCDKNLSCEAVECGDNYCSWWKNGKCNDVYELSDLNYGIVRTCIKRLYDKGIYI